MIAYHSRAFVMPDLIRYPAFSPGMCAKQAGPRIKSGVTAEK
jgi:hypothetical protein